MGTKADKPRIAPRFYRGYRVQQKCAYEEIGTLRCEVIVEHWNGWVLKLPPRYDLRNHSPTGFEWSYAGSGPAQLALALCAWALDDDERAQRIYQRVKFRLVGNLPYDGWTISQEELLKVIEECEREKGEK